MVVRTRLTDTEWRKVQRLAKLRDLTASQLVTQTLREHLLTPVKETT